LNHNQYVFCEKHSTINVVTAFTSDVINALEKKDLILSVFLDLPGKYSIQYYKPPYFTA